MGTAQTEEREKGRRERAKSKRGLQWKWTSLKAPKGHPGSWWEKTQPSKSQKPREGEESLEASHDGFLISRNACGD